MRGFDYRKLKEYQWDSEVLGLVAQIHEFKGRQELYVCVYTQCYAAVIDRIDKFPEKQLVVDIGSWMVDIMPIINHLPDESVCVTQPHGIITCIQKS